MITAKLSHLVASLRVALSRLLLNTAVLFDPTSRFVCKGNARDRLAQLVSPGEVVWEEAKEVLNKQLTNASQNAASCLVQPTDAQESIEEFAEHCHMFETGQRFIRARQLLLQLDDALAWLIDSELEYTYAVAPESGVPSDVVKMYRERLIGEQARVIELLALYASVTMREAVNGEDLSRLSNGSHRWAVETADRIRSNHTAMSKLLRERVCL